MKAEPLENIFLYCPPELLANVADLAGRAFISTFFSPCANIVEALKIPNSVCYHVAPYCLCQRANKRVVYLGADGKQLYLQNEASVPRIAKSVTEQGDLGALLLQDYALLHSAEFRYYLRGVVCPEDFERIERFHYEKARTRMFAVCGHTAIPMIYLIVQPCYQAFAAAVRARKLLVALGFLTNICYFGQAVTEEKLFNVSYDHAVFATLNTCSCRNVPWLTKRQDRSVLSFYELLCYIGAFPPSLDYESQLEVMMRRLEAFAATPELER